MRQSPHPAWILWFTAANILDAFSTSWGIAHGLVIEIAPVSAALLELGPITFFHVKMTLGLFAVGALYMVRKEHLLRPATIVLGGIAIATTIAVFGRWVRL